MESTAKRLSYILRVRLKWKCAMNISCMNANIGIMMVSAVAVQIIIILLSYLHPGAKGHVEDGAIFRGRKSKKRVVSP